MSVVSKAIYWAANRAERKRIAKELLKVEKFEAKHGPRVQAALREMSVPVPSKPTARIDLLAHATCGRPTPECTCTLPDGSPLRWA